MELKVWVDGVVRVVCGLSEDTSCQDVVIALAQAIGQTGRYVLIQRLRDSERQLLATERPLESLSKLGQHGGEVRFYLRRTGPSASDGPSPSPAGGSAPSPLLPPPLPPRPAEPEPPRRGGPPKKSLTFNLGPSSSPRTKAKALRRAPPPPQDSPESRASPRHGPPSPSPSPSPHHAPPSPSPSPSPAPTSPSPPVGPSKDELLRQVLQQQETLRAGHAHLEVLQKESRGWERPSPSPSPSPSVQEELELLERAARRNRAELASEPAWGEELTAEAERERALERRLAELRAKMDDCGRRLGEVAARSARLEQDVLREGGREGGGAGEEGEESLGAARAELRSRDRRGEELEAELKETDRALGKAESLLQSRQAELAELNKELRQCNLQQFIQQAGVLPSAHTHTPSDLDLHTHTHTPSDLDLHTHTHTPSDLDQLDLVQLLQEGYRNGGLSLLSSESPPRPTAKQFLGHPRNLQNPLVSSLNPEGVYV